MALSREERLFGRARPRDRRLTKLAADEAALLAAVLEKPDDDAPRLVYADVLQQRGDPRGEFIAVQCELSRLGEKDPKRERLEARAEELLEKHQATWVQPFMGDRHTTEIGGRKYTRTTPTSWDFDRGFVREATVSVGSFPLLSAALFAREPVRRVHLTGRVHGAAFEAPGLEKLRELDLTNMRLKDEAKRLFSAKHFAALEVLELRKCGLGVKGATAIGLADPKRWPRLRHLGLADNSLTDSALKQLARAPLLSRLRSLELSGDFFKVAGWSALVGSPFLTALEILDVNCGEVALAGAQALIESRARPTLHELSLRYVHLGDGGVAELARADFPKLMRLKLPFNELGPRVVSDVLKAPWAARLELLDLSENDELSKNKDAVRQLRARFKDRLVL